MTVASILHADLDSFFASVEQRDDPSLRGRPVIVGGGVVLAASYEAKAYGVRTAMGGAQARQLCPWAVVVSPRFEAYVEASRRVFEVFDDTTPNVEAMSIDEAFLDVGGLWRIAGSPVDIARKLRADVRERVGLPITVGVARTKFLAKVASALAKPDGLLLVDPERESEFLHPLPVERLWGVGEKTSAKLRDRGIHTVAEVAALDRETLVAILGRASGHHLHALANLRDPRPVVHRARRRSIGSQSAIGRGPHTAASIDATLVAVVDRVARRMRAAHRVGRTVVLRLRLADFTRITRSHTISQATANTAAVVHAARLLMAAAATEIDISGLTLVGLAVTNLGSDDALQLAFPFDAAVNTALDDAVDAINDRFGKRSLGRAVHLGRDVGWEAPRLAD